MEPVDTKQHILNAAELLFSHHGYKATSMRAITESAGVNLAAVNYHFGSKKALIESAMERRLRPLNEIRQKRLNELSEASRRTGQKTAVQDILRSFIEPVLLLKESRKGEADFSALIGRAFIDPDDTVQKIFLRLMKPVSQLMLDMLGDALPELPEDVIFWRYQFVIGALARIMRMYKNPRYESLQKAFKTDVESLMDGLIYFTSAGMEAPMKKKNRHRNKY